MTSAHETAIAAHKLSNTFTPGLFSSLQRVRYIASVMTTATSETEQPTIEMISNGLLD